jgi:hypothetical protein
MRVSPTVSHPHGTGEPPRPEQGPTRSESRRAENPPHTANAIFECYRA